MLRGKVFWSAERTPAWIKWAQFLFDDPLHKMIALPLGADYQTCHEMKKVWKHESGEFRLWDLIFVDHFPDEVRAPDIRFIRENNLAKVVVVHDASADMSTRMVGLEEELSKWKYRYNYFGKLHPGTSVVSNYYNVGSDLEAGLTV